MPEVTADDPTIRLTIGGKEYALHPDDLELGEVELLEEELDASLGSVDFTRAKAVRILAYILMHREDPTFEMDDAKALKVSSLGEPAAKKAEATPGPTQAPVASE